MQIKDAPFATLLVMNERMGEEMRHTYYVRREGEVPVNLKNFVPTFRVACTQGLVWRGT